jgi:hypothetical protein
MGERRGPVPRPAGFLDSGIRRNDEIASNESPYHACLMNDFSKDACFFAIVS